MPKSELYFDKPLMNAAGTLGFAPDPKGPVDIAEFGAFVTHPISRKPRKPARGTRFVSYPGGFLLHTGLPNPGLSGAIRRYAERWVRSPIPVILHLLAQAPDELAGMVERVELVEGIMGLEVGLPPDAAPNLVYQMAQATFGELPVILRVNLDISADIVQAIIEAGVNSISLGAPRGTLLDDNGVPVSGRLYGPGVYPLALKALEKFSGLGLSVIGGGGVYHTSEVDDMLKAGASAVQVGAALWAGGIFPNTESAE
ncbi:MAG: hypothetical protein ISR58_05525 [Anaerolineales bacterium]|nr:hypothetical protein [Chloroflexota bacterium]MBL6980635.1 hypothetical protein [Anaerolineales bacterium]